MGDVNIDNTQSPPSSGEPDKGGGGSSDQGQRQPDNTAPTRAPGTPAQQPGGPDAPTPPGQTAPKGS